MESASTAEEVAEFAATRTPSLYRGEVQRDERWSPKPEVAGSSPVAPANYYGSKHLQIVDATGSGVKFPPGNGVRILANRHTDVAQSVERSAHNGEVTGSNPVVCTNFLCGSSSVGQSAPLITGWSGVQVPPSTPSCVGIAQSVERDSYKVVVAGSIPATHTKQSMDVAQFGRALACEAGGRRFKSCRPYQLTRGRSSARIEQGSSKPRVVGSNPTVRTNY